MQELNAREGRGISELCDEIWEPLMAYNWPGNIRELKNLIEAAYANSEGGRIRIEDLPESFRERVRQTSSAGLSEREQLLSALLCTKWNKSKAAQELRWSRMTLYRKLAKYGLAKDK
jgi:two-component system response regulator HydG/two-component system response regulator AtoC